MKNRIKTIDGLRALCVLGVIWIHSWGFCNSPSFSILGIDVYRLVTIAGNGVDFFFVISGFCMYLIWGEATINVKSYLDFIKKRFYRIAPAFFASALVYALLNLYANPDFNFLSRLLINIAFLNNLIEGYDISGPFWSIGVEWQFYVLFPVIPILSKRFGLVRSIVFLSLLSLLFFAFINSGFLDNQYWLGIILVRFPEFAVGILAAHFYYQKKKLPKFLNGKIGLLLILLLTFLGRLFMNTLFLQRIPELALLLKTLSFLIMTGGFAILLFHLITLPSLLANLLSNRLISFIGRISYSIYLWHSLVFIMADKLKNILNFKISNTPITFILVSICSIIIGRISYTYFESFYFKRTSDTGIQLNSSKVA